MKRISDIFDKLTARRFWRFLGEGLTNRIRRRVRTGHRNVDGRPFVSYSKTYQKLKSQGMKMGGEKLDQYKGKSIASRSTTPDMTLTGKTMDDLNVRRVTENNVEIGWQGSSAGIVEHLHGHKNYQIVNLDGDPPFANKEMKFIDDEVNRVLDEGLKDFAKGDIVINIGPRR